MTKRVLTESHDKCGSPTRAGTPCQRPAGWGTDHVGYGRCKLHGGNAAIKHGRYSAILRGPFGEAVKRHMNDPNPLDLTPELAVLRGHIDWLTGEIGNGALREKDVESIRKTVAMLQKTADTVSKIQTREALTTSELRYIVGEFCTVLRDRIDDPDLLRGIMDQLERRIVVRAVPLLEGGE